MHIVNIMFSRGLGGIEQAFVDYTKALAGQSNRVTVVIRPGAQIEKVLRDTCPDATIEYVRNFSQWDPLAVRHLRKLLKEIEPDAIITHGNRSVTLAKQAIRDSIPIIGVTHNYSLERLIGLPAVFATTQDLHRLLIEKGQREDRIYRIPNMVDVPVSPPPVTLHTPPVIGTMGRFVKKKGFRVFLRALDRLRKKGVDFRAIIGGEGEELTLLKEFCETLGLDDIITFSGWVENRTEFFESIDIFCLPSLHEPFGIVLLEALAHNKPVVVTDTEGPSEIVKHNAHALVVPKGRAVPMTAALKTLVKLPKEAQKLAVQGLELVKTRYDIPVVGKQIQAALETIVKKHHE